MKYYPATESITEKIYLIRGHKVMLDRDLAELYRVEVFNLNKAVKRNLNRFPVDFMFQLTRTEIENLRFQIGISSLKHGGRRYSPYAFTEQGVAMLSSVLKSQRAADVNVAIMRAFVRLRRMLASSEEMSQKLHTLEKRLMRQGGHIRRHNEQIRMVFNAIYELMSPKQKLGFRMAS